MLSRVAENVYWFARYVERAENTARMILAYSTALLDLPVYARSDWKSLLTTLASEQEYSLKYDSFAERDVLRYLIVEKEGSSSIIFSLKMARENCRTIRGFIPRDLWERINELYSFAGEEAHSGITVRGRYDYLNEIITRSQTITGLTTGSILHDPGYDFLKMGRNLERADMTTRILDARASDMMNHSEEELKPFENIQWMAALQSLSAYHMYRRSVQARVNRPHVICFLLQEDAFPRAVSHSLGESRQCLTRLPRRDRVLKRLRKLEKDVLKTDAAAFSNEELHRFLDEIQIGIAEVHEQIAAAYFLSED